MLPHDGHAGQYTTEGRPLVSVIMIFFNPGPYMDEAVSSVLQQTMKDLELVLVDDGSTDGSSEKARAWARRDSRVVLITHPGAENRGTGASRALGGRHARGEWQAVLDSDDVWSPDHLERQLDMATRHPEAGIVIAPVRVWVSWRGEGEDFDLPVPYETDQLLPTGTLLESVTFNLRSIIPCGFMFRRSLTPPDGAADPAFRGLFEDQTMIARLTVAAPAVAVPTVTAYYRQHPKSVVNSAPGRGARDPATLRYLDWIEGFLATHGELTPQRADRLAAVRASFEPRWRFWLWYGSRWLALRVLPADARRWLRGGRMEATGRPADQG